MRGLVSKKRLACLLGLAVITYLTMAYDLSVPAGDAASGLSGILLDHLHTYGAGPVLLVLGIAALLVLWFRLFGVKSLFASPALCVLAVLFGLLNAAALHLFYRNTLPWGSVLTWLLFLLQAAVWAFLFLLGAVVILRLLTAVGDAFSDRETLSGTAGFGAWVCRHIGLVAFSVIFLCWLPWLVSYYPASMEWDVYAPIRQALGFDPPSNRHPWFYVTVIGFAYRLGQFLGDQNFGIFLYSLGRAVVMAAIYARCCVLQRKAGAPGWLPVATMLFFAVTPVWGAYAKHAFKDALAAALFCWYILALIEVVRLVREKRLRVLPCLEYSAAVLFSALFRNNLVYIALPVTAVLIFSIVAGKLKLRYGVLLLLGLLLFEGYQGYILNVLGVEPGNAREALSVPIQQTARTVVLHGEEIAAEDMAVLLEYFPGECLWWYDPIISDPVKEFGDDYYQSMRDYIPFLRVWGRLFSQFPGTYLEAFIAHSSGYYAFTPEYTEAQRYGPGSHVSVGMTIFNWVEDPRFSEWLHCHYSPRFAGARRVLDNWPELWHQIPVLNLTDTKPLYTWTVVLMAYLLLKRKEYWKLLPVCAWLLLVLGFTVSPVNDCFRYFSLAAAAFPALLPLLKQGS